MHRRSRYDLPAARILWLLIIPYDFLLAHSWAFHYRGNGVPLVMPCPSDLDRRVGNGPSSDETLG